MRCLLFIMSGIGAQKVGLLKVLNCELFGWKVVGRCQSMTGGAVAKGVWSQFCVVALAAVVL